MSDLRVIAIDGPAGSGKSTVARGVADCLDHFAADYHTRAILLCLDRVADARRFMSAARAAAREIHPAFGYRATVGYKKRVTETVVERAIHTALERAGAKVNGQAAG